VANVSHELKTPVGALSLLAETLDGEDDPDVVARLVTRVAAEAERLGRIIDDLLDLSRIETNEAPRQEMVPPPSSSGRPSSCCDRRAQLGRETRGRRATPSAGRPGRPPGPGVGGEQPGRQRHQVLGARFAGPGENPRHEGDAGGDLCHRPGRRDPVPDLERIFERFYRVDRARSRLTGGTGLGLSIVRHVAVNHSGSVRVESREGEGSTFTLLPACRPASHCPGCPICRGERVDPATDGRLRRP
jgi:two-component system sensor histidine kinase SenX3